MNGPRPTEPVTTASGASVSHPSTFDPPSLHHSPPPPAIPDFDVVRRIGGGSYGEVWLVRNLAIGTWRAAKVVHRSAFDDDRPFEREFRGILKFEPISHSHESQVKILHVGRNEAEGYFYYVMELADDANSEREKTGKAAGENFPLSPSLPFSPATYTPKTLRRLLSAAPVPTGSPASASTGSPAPRSRLPPAECVEIGLALTTALAHLHVHGLVHRDIKPSNIIFVGGVPKLADIGLVTDVDASRSFVGTEGFLPPEGPGTPQADLYSLGKVLYEMSTGRDRKDYPALPLEWDALDAAEQARLLELNEVLVKVCEADPRRRYQTAEQLREDLALLQRGESAKRRRVVERRWAIGKEAGFAIAALALIAAAGWWFLSSVVSEPNERNVARALSPAMVGTKNLEAFKRYEKACVFFRHFTIDGEKLAREYLNEAIRLDPDFVAAYDLLFLTYVNSLALPAEEVNAGLRATAKKLTDLVPHSAEAQYANAYIKFFVDLDLAEAEKGFRHAIRLNPVSGVAHLYGCHLVFMGRPREARKELRRFDDLDPGFPIVELLLGMSYYEERNYDLALAHYRKALDLAPNYITAHLLAGRAHEAKDDYLKALDYFRQQHLLMGESPENVNARYDARRQAFKESGARGYWLKCLEQFQNAPNPEAAPYRAAQIFAQLGQKDQALDCLEQAYTKRDGMESLLVDHYWAGLRDEPRFQSLLRKVGYLK